MKLWGYYAWHTLVNSIKKMFKSTVLAIIAMVIVFIVIFGVVGAVIGGVAASMASDAESTEVSTEIVLQMDGEDTLAEEDDADVTQDDEEMTPEDIAMVKTWVEAGVALLLLWALLWGMYSGSKNGTDIFQMADVNFLFTAPIKPQSVLLFRLSFQMVAAVFGSFYLVFQIPNLVVNVGLGAEAVTAVFVGWILFCVLQRLMMVLSYTVFTTHEKLKPYVLPLILLVIAVIALPVAVVFWNTGCDVYRTVQLTFASSWARWIPIIGWYKAMIMCAVNGQVPAFIGYLLLMLIGVGVFMFLIWQIKADFYEDALSSANKNAQQKEAVQEGRTLERTKERSKRISRTGTFGGEGAQVFLTKELYCRKRMAKFGFVTNTMLFYLAVCVLGGLVTARIMDSSSFLVIGMILMVSLFIRNFGNPIAQETSLNWLFLVPDSPYKKVFYAMLAGTCGCTLDLLPGLVVAEILIKENPLMMLLWLATFVVVDFMLSAVGVLLEAICPASALDMVKSLIQMFLRMGMILVLMVFIGVGFLIGGQIAALILTMVASLGLGAVAFIIYPSFLHEGMSA